MLKFPYLCIVIALFLVEVNCSSSIADDITKYYDSVGEVSVFTQPTANIKLRKSFKLDWQKYKTSYEHAIAELVKYPCLLNQPQIQALKENVGVLAMNNYVRHAIDPRFLIAGNLLTDDIVSVELHGMKLRDMPRLILPVVTLAPASHLLRLESTLTKMFIDTEYSRLPLKAYNHKSPFAWEYLQNDSLTIIAEDCFLSGFSITTFAGTSLNLGHSQFLISGCKFTVEITPSDISLPPVIKPYFNKTYAQRIEKLLTRAFQGELESRLQGALFTFVNTTVCDRLPQIRSAQKDLFKRTTDYMSNLCVKLNNMTLQTTKEPKKMDTLDSRKNVLLYGLDTAYTAGDGGSFEASTPSIADAIKFRKMQIRTQRGFREPMDKNTFDYAAELTDVTVNVILNVKKDGSYSANKLEFVGWRTVEFSDQLRESELTRRNWMESRIAYYLMVQLEKHVISHLTDMLNTKKLSNTLPAGTGDKDESKVIDPNDIDEDYKEKENGDQDVLTTETAVSEDNNK